MKPIYLFIIIMFFVKCKVYTASEFVVNEIKKAEESIDDKKFGSSNFLENLSGIKCEEKKIIGHQSACIPTKELVKKWKKWYSKNKDDFYFNNNYECFELLNMKEKDREKIVFLKDKNSNEIRNSLSKQKIDICYILKNRQKVNK